MDLNEDTRALIAEAQAGNVRAFELLISKHFGQIRRFARAFAQSDADADDLAQDALVKVYKNFRSFRVQSAFTTWLYTLVRNVLLDNARSRAGHERAVEEPLSVGHSRAASEVEPADVQLAHEEDRQRLWHAVRQLPVEFRSAIVLFDIEGHSYDEVAAIEGVPVGTVKSRLSRGRTQLRQLLGVDRGPEPHTAGTSAASIPSQVSRSHP